MIYEPRLFIDMDGVLVEYIKVTSIEVFYNPGFFEALPPIKNVIKEIKKFILLHNDVKVYSLSAIFEDSKYCISEKNNWLDKHLPEIKKEHRLFSVCGKNKQDYIPGSITKQDFLLDDYTANLIRWGGTGIKALNGLNHTNQTWQKNIVDLYSAKLEKKLYHIIERTIK